MYNLAIVKSRTITPSETFIMQHVTRMKNVRVFLEGFPVQVHTPPFDEMEIFDSAAKTPFLPRLINTPLGAFIADRFVHRARSSAYRAVFRDLNINAILAEFGPSGVNVLPVARKLGIPLVCIFHGYDAFDRRVLRLYSAQYTRLFHSAAGLIVVSEEMHKQLLALGAPSEKVVTWNYGVDTELFQPGSSFPQFPFTFLSIGRLVEKKGTMYSLQAFDAFHKIHPDSRYIIVGSGPLEKSLRTYVSNNDLSNAVYFAGLLPHAQIRKLLHQVHVLLHHAVEARHGDREGTPLVIQEAMACGIPVIGTRHAGIVNEIDDGVSGYLVNEKDVNAMTQRMHRLYDDQEHWRALSKAARKKVLSHFSSTVQIRTLDEILCRICGLQP